MRRRTSICQLRKYPGAEVRSIFDFWRDVPNGVHIHPADVDVLSRVDHGFELRCLPGQWMGPLATAKAVFLYLSPGLTPFDLSFALDPTGQRWHALQRTGCHPLPGPDEHGPAFKWWSRRAGAYGAWGDLRAKIAFANIGAYHSRTFDDLPLLAALPSSRAMLDWAQGALFEEARRGDRIVVCMRSARFWGLEPGWSEGGLVAPVVGRGGYLRHGPNRVMLEERLRQELLGP